MKEILEQEYQRLALINLKRISMIRVPLMARFPSKNVSSK